MSKTTIYLAEEDDVIRLGHKHIIEKASQFELVGESHSIAEISESVRELKPSIVVLSWTLAPEMTELARSLLRFDARPQVLLVLSDAEDFFDALRTYARGYILKQTQSWVFPIALDALARDTCFIEPYIAGYLLEGDGRFRIAGHQISNHHHQASDAMLTAKEKRVMLLLADGLSNGQIAANLHISIETVRVHLKNIYRKLGVAKRDEAIEKMKQVVRSRAERSTQPPGSWNSSERQN